MNETTNGYAGSVVGRITVILAMALFAAGDLALLYEFYRQLARG